jgi:CheY-like chemotaxis protein
MNLPPKGARVVVVNDAPAILDLYREMLEELKYVVVVMTTDAVETQKIRQADPDAVVLDMEVGLQPRYGVQMAQELRSDSRYRSMPIVVATANAGALDGARGTLEALRVPLLIQPFTVEQLRDALARTE